MGGPIRVWRRAGSVAVLAFGAASLSAGGLVRAQQAAAPPSPSPGAAAPLRPAEPPPGALAPAVPPPDDQIPASGEPVAEAPPKPAAPLKRPRYAIAILQALDKVTAETERFEVPLNTPIRYKTLIFTVRACETTAADEDIVDAIAHVEVISQPKAPEGGVAPPARQVFKGWMFANSPGLNPFEHPIYDAWLIACKTELPSA